jgi:hypothetical protein
MPNYFGSRYSLRSSGDNGDNLRTNLISFWELEAASGTRVDAVVASANDLTDTNTVTQSTGKVGQAAQFTGANNESLHRVHNASLTTGDIEQTFCVWVYLDSKPGYATRIITKSSVADGGYNAFWVTGTDRFQYQLIDSGGAGAATVTANSLGAPSLATWYFVVGWFDPAANTIYIQVNDGTIDSAAQTAAPAGGTGVFVIGNSGIGDNRCWDGRLDQVGFWKRVLTAAERAWLYNSGNGRAYSELGP